LFPPYAYFRIISNLAAINLRSDQNEYRTENVALLPLKSCD
jgi:hypothetical protein